MCETRAGLLSGLETLLARLDVDAMTAEHAKELVTWFSRMERLSVAGKTLCAGRVASTGLHSESGQRSAADWLAKETGDSVPNAVNLLETANKLKKLPELEDAVRSGDLSPAQTALAAGAAAEDPSKEKDLIAQAKTGSVRDLRRAADRVRHAKRTEQEARARYEAIRASRFLRWWTDPDGAFRLDGRLTPDAGARLVAEIEAEAKRVFTEARRQGRREPLRAYAADALVSLVTGLGGATTPAAAGSASAPDSGSAPGSGSSSGPGGSPSPGSPFGPGSLFAPESPSEPDTRSGPAESEAPARAERRESTPGPRRASHSVILRVDLAALRRGELEGNEICEIPGVGPVPLAVARELIGDAFLKLVITDGVDVQTVCHLGRHVSAFIDTALQERDAVCVVPGCNVATFLERDHWREEFAKGGPTDLPNLALLCRAHHHLKHHKGFTLTGGPGKWEWIAPKDATVGDADPPPWRTGTG